MPQKTLGFHAFVETFEKTIFPAERQSFEKLVRAGCDRTSLLAHLRATLELVESENEDVYKIPKWLKVSELQLIVQEIEDLRGRLTRIEKTAIGPTGSLTKYRGRMNFTFLRRVPLDLEFYASYLNDTIDDLRSINRNGRRSRRANAHSYFVQIVFALIGKRPYEAIADVLQAGYRALGHDITINGETLKKTDIRTRKHLSGDLEYR